MRLDFTTDKGAGGIANLGLIVLQSDETIETEFRQLIPEADVALYHSRIPSAPYVTAETLATMEANIPASCKMFPDKPLDVIGYACTSGATVIGPDVVTKAVHSVHPEAKVTDPLSATIAWCKARGITRIGFLTPYVATVSELMRQKLIEAGLEIAAFGSFEQEEEKIVARIDAPSLIKAMQEIDTAECQAIFVSCTNLRVAEIVAKASGILGKPVVSSNTALAWHMRHLAGIEE